MHRFFFSCVAFSLIALSTLTGNQDISSGQAVVVEQGDFDLLALEIENLEKKALANQEKAEGFKLKSKGLMQRNRVRARMLMQRARHHEKVMHSAQHQVEELKKRLEERKEEG